MLGVIVYNVYLCIYFVCNKIMYMLFFITKEKEKVSCDGNPLTILECNVVFENLDVFDKLQSQIQVKVLSLIMAVAEL